MAITRNFVLLLIALAASHVYRRLQAIWSLDKNAPGRLQPFSTFPSYEIKFAGKIRNCEDGVMLDDSNGWALLSCDFGRDKWNTVMVGALFRLLSSHS